MRIGIDIGGTFTDFVVFDRRAGTLETFKLLSTPGDPAAAVLEGLHRLRSKRESSESKLDSGSELDSEPKPDFGRELDSGFPHGARPERIVHGSTVATNAVLERRGAAAALVTTEGFRDVLRIGRQARPALYDLRVELPEPLVPAERCFELAERVDRRGEVIKRLEEAQLDRLVSMLEDAGAESVAVSLLFSFARPEHEARVADRLREAGFFVSASHEVLSEFREYERTSTTLLDAYVTPVLDRYLARLERELGTAEFRIMQSNGGSARAGEARRQGVRSVLSGPAGGVVGAVRVAGAAGLERVITFDMGGTSTDVSLADGEPRLTAEGEIAGLPVRVPIVDLHTVGSGGGSVAYVDAGGALRVGPRSAGADPGPACYARGGQEPTVTDANLVLGRLPADRFLGGAMELDVAAARAALERLAAEARIGASAAAEEAEPGLDSAERAALGVIRVVEAHMERALRVISVERGHDPADFALVSFGGAGGLHATRLARALGIGRVLVPPEASTLSALGMLLAPVARDYVLTVMLPGDAAHEELEERVRPLRERGRADLRAEGVAEEEVELRAELDVRYAGQSWELTVPLAPDYLERFHAAHEEAYGHADREGTVEVVNLRLRASGALPAPRLPEAEPGPADPSAALLDRRPVVVEGGRREVPFYLAERLRPGHRLQGPAVVVRSDTTILLEPGDRAEVDRGFRLVIEPGGTGSAAGGRSEDVSAQTSAEVSAPPGERQERTEAGAPAAVSGVPDPVRLEVFKHLFSAVAEEMGGVLRRAAFSPNIKERRDYSCAVFDAAGEMVAQAAHIPVHLGAMPLSVRACVDALELGPGDVAILNDPFRGGTHLPDITLVSPVFVGANDRGAHAGVDLLGYVATRAHHADVGGMAPGSMTVARELYQEGLVIPPARLVRAGEVEAGVWGLIMANVRTPEERAGDLRAQLAAHRRGESRLRELAAHYGRDEVAARMEALLAYAERTVRRLLADLPDGTYRFEDRMDDDGVDDDPAEIRVAVTVASEEATVDFTGTCRQRAGGINAVRAITLSAVTYVFRCLVGLDVPTNSGCLRPVRLIAPAGTLVNARRPAAVAAGNVETSQRIVDVLLGAMAGACPERVPAASQGTMNNVTIGGVDPERGRPFAYYETVAGGTGAAPDADGAHAVHSHMTNTLNTPAEALEYAYPLRVRRYEVRRGSGGAGRQRGGDGIRRDLEVLASGRLSLLTERRRFAPYGLAGGSPGARGRNVLIRDGEERELPGKGTMDLRAGDVVSVRTPGGGGHGSPD